MVLHHRQLLMKLDVHWVNQNLSFPRLGLRSGTFGRVVSSLQCLLVDSNRSEDTFWLQSIIGNDRDLCDESWDASSRTIWISSTMFSCIKLAMNAWRVIVWFWCVVFLCEYCEHVSENQKGSFGIGGIFRQKLYFLSVLQVVFSVSTVL